MNSAEHSYKFQFLKTSSFFFCLPYTNHQKNPLQKQNKSKAHSFFSAIIPKSSVSFKTEQEET